MTLKIARQSALASLAFLIIAVAAASPLGAQPSGGPYGPVQLKYEVPADAPHVHYVAPDGRPEAGGNSIAEPTTLDAAIERATTGDAIILRGGAYRTGGLQFNQRITLQPYENERPIIKGTEVADQWERLPDNRWRTAWQSLFPMEPQPWWQRNREETRTPLYKFNGDMVFVDGEPLRPVGSQDELDRDAYYVDYDERYVYIAANPARKLVEITAHDVALTRTTAELHGRKSDAKGPTVRGLTFTQYAFRAIELEGYDPEGVSPEAEHGKDYTGSTFEHCSFTHCARVAGYFRGDGLTIRHCLVSDTGTEGLFVLNSNDVLLERNVVTRNNITGITGYYASAIKIYNQCHRVTCRENLIIDNPNQSSGIWYDVGEVDGVFVGNWIERTDNGFFFEISQGAICAGNVFVDCGTGIKILNSRKVRVYQNTLVNSTAWFERTPRSAVGDHFGWHPATGPDVDERDGHEFVGNLLVADESFRQPLLIFAQSRQLRDRLTEPQLTRLDHNIYVRQSPPTRTLRSVYPIPADFQTPDDMRSLNSAFEAHSQTFDNYFGPLFQSQRLRRFELLAEFPAAHSAAPLPDEVLKLLAWPRDHATVPGAFPVAK